MQIGSFFFNSSEEYIYQVHKEIFNSFILHMFILIWTFSLNGLMQQSFNLHVWAIVSLEEWIQNKL